MSYTSEVMDRIVERAGVSKDANYPFRTGYMEGLIEEIIGRFPEARSILEYHDPAYKETV